MRRPDAGRRLATLHPVIENARQAELDLDSYLADLLTRVSHRAPGVWLPRAWQRAHDDSIFARTPPRRDGRFVGCQCIPSGARTIGMTAEPSTRSDGIGRQLYGLLFAGVIPFGLWCWARALEQSFPLAPVHWAVGGMAIGVAGFALMAAGIIEIIARGGGLPINAFPPTRLVRSGVFRWIDNPIYVGFGFLVVGWALVAGSAPGLWVVTRSPLSR
jgi:hypothetical protein